MLNDLHFISFLVTHSSSWPPWPRLSLHSLLPSTKTRKKKIIQCENDQIV